MAAAAKMAVKIAAHSHREDKLFTKDMAHFEPDCFTGWSCEPYANPVRNALAAFLLCKVLDFTPNSNRRTMYTYLALCQWADRPSQLADTFVIRRKAKKTQKEQRDTPQRPPLGPN